MFGWTKKEKGDKTSLEMDDNIVHQEQEQESDKPTQEEQLASAKIDSDFEFSRSTRESECDESGFSIEDDWEDDYYMFKGGGLQWLTHFAYRTKKARKIRPNSENNFTFNALIIQHANITAQTPDICFYATESDENDGDDDVSVAKKLTDASRFNNERNVFPELWKKFVFDFISSGPTIAMIIFDSEWIGGRGPQRWVGDVRTLRIDKWDFYPDPAIKDLIRDLQDCSYIIRRPRKKLEYIAKRWGKKGRMVGSQENEDDLIYEGGDPNQAYVMEYWHRGFPWFVPDERKKELNQRAVELEQEGDIYKAQDYYDSAKGDLESVHVAYYSDGILLEYRPYEYEHGMYPFVYTTRYEDDKSAWGWGEIRNVKIPQVIHNKADEIEIEAMSRQGLGGKDIQKGAMSEPQKQMYNENAGKGGVILEFDQLNLVKDRDGVQVPASITNFKEHKQKMVETISGNTDIQQGISPGANIPFASIEALGQRSDTRTNSISEKLEDFIKRIEKFKVELFAQFYTEERHYRIRGNKDEVIEGTIKNTDIINEWTRDVEMREEINPETGEAMIVPFELKEKYVPEFDIKVTVISEKPTDRNYYTNLGKYLYEQQILSVEDYLNTLEEGKLPPTQDIIDSYYAREPMIALMSQLAEMPPEISEVVNQQIQEASQNIIQSAIMQQQQLEQGGMI